MTVGTVSTAATWNAGVVRHVEEAFERIGIRPNELVAEHWRSALYSLELLSVDWENYGYNQYQMVFKNEVLVQSDTDFYLPAGGIDIFHAALKYSDGRKREMYPISRSDYNALHNPTEEGEPDRYFVDKSTYVRHTTEKASRVYLYQVPDASTYSIDMWYIRGQYGDQDGTNALDMSPSFFEAFAAGLAFFLSKKFRWSDERLISRLGVDYLGNRYNDPTAAIGGALGRAMDNNRDSADAHFRVSFDRFRGRR